MSFPADFPGARVRPSPNFGDRRGMKPDALILHYTGMASGAAAEDWLCNPEAQVSSHYLVHEGGEVVQMVPEAARAWHAGQSSWMGATDLNSHSIGIEIVNPGHDFGYPDFPDAQIAAVAALCRDVCRRQGIVRHRVLAHSDIAPQRKIDPGEKFPWAVLAQEGVGHYVDPAPLAQDIIACPGEESQAARTLQAKLAAYGYGVDISGFLDAETIAVVKAFQRHFRPERVDGVADSSTMATLEKLLGALS